MLCSLFHRRDLLDAAPLSPKIAHSSAFSPFALCALSDRTVRPVHMKLDPRAGEVVPAPLVPPFMEIPSSSARHHDPGRNYRRRHTVFARFEIRWAVRRPPLSAVFTDGSLPALSSLPPRISRLGGKGTTFLPFLLRSSVLRPVRRITTLERRWRLLEASGRCARGGGRQPLRRAPRHSRALPWPRRCAAARATQGR